MSVTRYVATLMNLGGGYQTEMIEVSPDAWNPDSVYVKATDYDQLQAQLAAVTADRDKWQGIAKSGITDICDFEKEMEDKHGMEFADDYGGVWQGDAVTKHIEKLEQRTARLEAVLGRVKQIIINHMGNNKLIHKTTDHDKDCAVCLLQQALTEGQKHG